MGIFRDFFFGVKQVTEERLCWGCLQPFTGEGYKADGHRYCAIACAPGAYPDGSDQATAERERRLRIAGGGMVIFLIAVFAFPQTKPQKPRIDWRASSFGASSVPVAIVSTTNSTAPLAPGEVRELGELAPFDPSMEVAGAESETPTGPDYILIGGGRHGLHHGGPIHHPSVPTVAHHAATHTAPAPAPAPRVSTSHAVSGSSGRRTQ